MHSPGDVRVENVPGFSINEYTDALVVVTHTAISGSGLWPNWGHHDLPETRTFIGLEFISFNEAVGFKVHAVTLKLVPL